eukprot:c32542_g1_i1.p1 GENE.c32542_g1_i1~~c32542_g1_i1.p1  ORF type:complete len:703 (-),score=197.66 c32542_g1_i1:23-2131(-)
MSELLDLVQQLPYLQNKMKRDRDGYKKEYQMQLERFLSLVQIMEMKPETPDKTFPELCNFLAHVSSLYPETQDDFVSRLLAFVDKHHLALERTVRSSLVSSLILLRNKQALPVVKLLALCFKLFRCADKPLRQSLHKHLVRDIKNINRQTHNAQLNRNLQNLLFGMVNDTSPVAAKKCLDVMVDLYKRRVWNNAQTANVMAEACFSPHPKVCATAISFFIGVDDMEEEAPPSDDDAAAPSRRDVYNALHKGVSRNKKTKRKLDKALKKVQKQDKKTEETTASFTALHLLRDPQSFGERLFNALKTSTDGFATKMKLMHIISRIMGMHQLLVLPFFPFVQRYLRPSQPEVSQILAFVAQATHELIPPDVIRPILTTLANEFVSDRSSTDAQSAGLNTIRELCLRCPEVMDETLLRDLVQYKNDRDNSVRASARSLTMLFRKLNPALLHKKDRGKEGASLEGTAMRYGELKAESGVVGIELLEEDLANRSQEEEGDGWEAQPESESDDGWATVSTASEREELSDNQSEGSSSDSDQGSDQDDEEAAGAGDQPEGEQQTDQPKPVRKERLDEIRILTPADFRRLQVLRTAKEVERITGGKRKRADSSSVPQFENKEKVEIDDIIGQQKKRKQNKEERIQKIMEGREGRGKFGHKAKKMGTGGLTNKEKSKKKVVSMIKRSRARTKKKPTMSRAAKAKQFKGKFRK